MELLRKLLFGLKHIYKNAGAISCMDIRNIVTTLDDQNKSIITYEKEELPVSSDVNTMYDVIWGTDVHHSINKAVNQLLPPNFISTDEVNLLHKSLDIVYKYAYFEYEFYDDDYTHYTT